jgi:hypothetical protein
MLKPFKENRYQRFLRTVVWPWRHRHPMFSLLLVLVPYFGALRIIRDHFEHNLFMRIALIGLAMVILMSYLYAAQCHRRYERYLSDLSILHTTEKTHQMFEQMGVYTRSPFADGHDVIQGEVVPREDEPQK